MGYFKSLKPDRVRNCQEDEHTLKLQLTLEVTLDQELIAVHFN